MHNIRRYKITLKSDAAQNKALDKLLQWLGNNAINGIIGTVVTTSDEQWKYKILGISALCDGTDSPEEIFPHLLLERCKFDNLQKEFKTFKTYFEEYNNFANLFDVKPIGDNYDSLDKQ